MKKRLKVYGLIVATLLATAFLVTFWSTELSAISWHLRHGFHADLGGVRVRVPFSYEASDPHGLPSLWIDRLPGVLWRDGGFIFLDFQRLPSPEAIEAAESLLKSKGKDIGISRMRVGERTAMFAGKQGKCIEYNTRASLPEPLKGYAMTGFEIQCRFGDDVSASLMGSPTLKNDFYNIIQTAKLINEKR